MKTSRKLTIAVIVVAAVAGYLTRPDKQAHKEALGDAVGEIMKKELGNGAFADMEAAVGSGVGALEVASRLNVEDLYVCNIGRIGEENTGGIVSVGAFGRVFVLKNHLKDALAVI